MAGPLREVLGTPVAVVSAITANAAAPTANEGIAVSALRVNANGRSARRHAILVDLGDTGSAEIHLWVKLDAAWYYTGALNNGSALSGATRQLYAYQSEDAGLWDRVYHQVLNVTGDVSVTTRMAEILEVEDAG